MEGRNLIPFKESQLNLCFYGLLIKYLKTIPRKVVDNRKGISLNYLDTYLNWNSVKEDYLHRVQLIISKLPKILDISNLSLYSERLPYVTAHLISRY